jgi:hypothetical protein
MPLTALSRRKKENNMKTIFSRLSLILSLAIVLTACGGTAATIPAVTPSQSMPLPADLRDFRYCEILPAFQSGLTLNIEVWNTMSLNDCPADLWAKLDANAMAEQYGASLVILNGPRHWLFNKVTAGGTTAAGKFADFGGIEMKQLATLQMNIWQGSAGGTFYTPNQVDRTTVFTYWAGNQIYELISPDGDTYVMQSYAQIVEPNLTINDLNMLGERLNLPKGWKYQARTLDADLELTANGVAYVLQDDLQNSYQKMTP